MKPVGHHDSFSMISVRVGQWMSTQTSCRLAFAKAATSCSLARKDVSCSNSGGAKAFQCFTTKLL